MMILGAIATLIGCSAPNEGRLLADAGSSVQGEPGDLFVLDGGDSLGTALSWYFAERPSGSVLGNEDLQDAETAWPWFIADSAGTYTLELLACDSEWCEVDRVQLGVGTHGKPLISGRVGQLSSAKASRHGGAPTAKATQGRSLLHSGDVILDGSGSTDPNGDPLSWRWSFVQRPGGSMLRSADIEGRSESRAAFLPDVSGSYTVRLWVSDGWNSDSVDVVVVVDRAIDGDALPL